MNLGDRVGLGRAEQGRVSDVLRVRLHVPVHLAEELAVLLGAEADGDAPALGPLLHLRVVLLGQAEGIQSGDLGVDGAVDEQLRQEVLVLILVGNIGGPLRGASVVEDCLDLLEGRIDAGPEGVLVERGEGHWRDALALPVN